MGKVYIHIDYIFLTSNEEKVGSKPKSYIIFYYICFCSVILFVVCVLGIINLFRFYLQSQYRKNSLYMSSPKITNKSLNRPFSITAFFFLSFFDCVIFILTFVWFM